MLTASDSFTGQDRKQKQVTALENLYFQPPARMAAGFSGPDRASEKEQWLNASKKQMLRLSARLAWNHTLQNMRFVIRFGNFSSSFRTKEDLKADNLISKYYVLDFTKKDMPTEQSISNTNIGNSFENICQFIDLKLKLLGKEATDMVWSSSSLTPKAHRQREQTGVKDNTKPTADAEDLSSSLTRMRLTEWRNIGTEKFLIIATKNRIESAALQQYVVESELSQHFVDLVHKCRKALMADKLGCHVLRRAVLKSASLRSSVMATAQHRLLEYSSCEHSSRVLQALARFDEPLRMECLRVFSRHWKFLAAHISAIYLYTVCLELTANSHPIFTEFRKIFVNNLELVIKSKNSKRVLVSYLEYCGEYDLNLFFGALGFGTFFVKRMDDKYMVYIFSVFLAREYEDAVDILISNLKNNMRQLLATKYFKFLLHRIQQKIHNPKVIFVVYGEIAAFLKQISRLGWAGELLTENESGLTLVNPQDAAFFVQLVPASVLYEKLELEEIDKLVSRLLDCRDPQQAMRRGKNAGH